jgi:hypothetical protein
MKKCIEALYNNLDFDGQDRGESNNDCYAYTPKYSYMIKTENTVRCRLE